MERELLGVLAQNGSFLCGFFKFPVACAAGDFCMLSVTWVGWLPGWTVSCGLFLVG